MDHRLRSSFTVAGAVSGNGVTKTTQKLIKIYIFFLVFSLGFQIYNWFFKIRSITAKTNEKTNSNQNSNSQFSKNQSKISNQIVSICYN
jgi:hypothetical protein